jgi:maleylacetoacetate isomerase/maleylpyruvate isomerase
MQPGMMPMQPMQPVLQPMVPQPRSPSVRVRERKAGKCMPAAGIAAVQPVTDGRLPASAARTWSADTVTAVSTAATNVALGGMETFERELAQYPVGRYCYGDTPTLADCILVPQIFNGQRFNVDFSGLTRTLSAFEACMALPAFQQAQPSSCPDNEA